MTAEPVDLVGPHGYTHGWIYHGPPGARAGQLTPEHHAILHGRRAKTARQHRNAATEYKQLAGQHTGKAQEHAQRMARFHRDRARALEGRTGQTARLKAAAGKIPEPKPGSSQDQIRNLNRYGVAMPSASQKAAYAARNAPSFNRKKALRGIRQAQARAGATRGNQGLAAANDGPALELARHQPIDPKIKLGSGGRFRKMKAKLAARGARNPGALAAFIGRRAYGAKKFGALSAKGHAHSNTSLALELAAMDRYPKYPVSSPYDVLVIRGDDGSAVIRHRRGGYEIARIRRTDEGSWVASRDGRDMAPHTRQRGALLEAIGAHNKSSGTPYHRAEQSEPLQPPPAQTPLMAAYGIPAVRALATPTVGSSDGPRATDTDDKTGTGLGKKGQTIYKKLRSRGFPHERAHNFARRAQNKGRGK